MTEVIFHMDVYNLKYESSQVLMLAIKCLKYLNEFWIFYGHYPSPNTNTELTIRMDVYSTNINNLLWEIQSHSWVYTV